MIVYHALSEMSMREREILERTRNSRTIFVERPRYSRLFMAFFLFLANPIVFYSIWTLSFQNALMPPQSPLLSLVDIVAALHPRTSAYYNSPAQ